LLFFLKLINTFKISIICLLYFSYILLSGVGPPKYYASFIWFLLFIIKLHFICWTKEKGKTWPK
jgi:hypothetical protein